MTSALVAVDALIATGPMPLAQLARRARNAKTGAAVLQNAAHYLGEAGARLAAAYWLGRAIARHGGPTEAMQPHLSALLDRGAAFGAWVGLLRESAAATGGDALAALSKPLEDIVPLEAFAAAITEERAAFGDDGSVFVSALGQARRRGILGFLEFLVTFRNKVYGHGAMLAEAACQRLALPCLTAVAHVLRQPSLLEGGWLGRTAVDLFRPESPRYWKRLHGVSETEMESGQPAPPAADISPRSLHVVGPAGPVSLSFLVVQDEDATGLSRFGFFQRLIAASRRSGSDKVKGVEYLDYLGGPFRDDTRAEEVSGALPTGSGRGAESSADAPPVKHSAGERRFGDFVVEAELGRGAMGIVYRATQISLGRKVALKVLPPGMLDDTIALGRFHREVQALGRCDHPNVVRVVTSGIEEGRPFFAMELVEGADLAAVFATLSTWKNREGVLKAGHLSAASSSARDRARQSETDPALAGVRREEPALPVSLKDEGDLFERIALLFAGAADGVEEIHRRGLVHRDLKPANLMLTAQGDRLIVMDLGLAKITEASVAYTTAGGGDFVGSARYAAPEQIQARLLKVDHRADIYSLGATLYEVATLHAIYPGEELAALLQKKLSEDPRPARELDRRIPKDLETILQKATARRPEDRYDSAAALASDLRAFAEGRPIDARPPSPFDYLRLFYRRQRRLVQLGAGASVMLLAVLVAGLLLVSRERTRAVAERDRAEELATFIADDLYERLRPLGKLKLLSDVTERIVAHYASRDLDTPVVVARYAHSIVRAGRVRESEGRLGEARAAFDRACTLLEALQAKHGQDPAIDGVLAIALDARGRVSMKQNQLDAARTDSDRALSIRSRLVDRDPEGREPRRDLADSLMRSGDLSEQQGRVADALSAYQRAMELHQWLMDKDPTDARAAPELADALCAAGNMLGNQGKLDEALAHYERARDLCAEILRRDPANSAAQVTMAHSHDDIAGVLTQKDDLPGALVEYQNALQLRERLVRMEPGSAVWQSNLSTSYHYVASILKRQGHIDQALDYYRKDLEITRRLAEQDPSNTDWQHSLSVSLSNSAELLKEKGRQEEALAELREVLAIRERLAGQDPSNTQWQRELAVSHEHIGAASAGLAKLDEALEAMRKGLEITQRLAKQDPANAGWQRDLAVSLAVIARVYERRGNPEQAMASLDEARPIAEKLTALDPKNMEWKEHFAYIEYDRGRLLDIAGRQGEATAAYRKVLDIAGRHMTAVQKPESIDSLREHATQAVGRAPIALESARKAGTAEPPAPGAPPPGGPALLESQRQAPRKQQAPAAPSLRHERPRPGNDPLDVLY